MISFKSPFSLSITPLKSKNDSASKAADKLNINDNWGLLLIITHDAINSGFASQVNPAQLQKKPNPPIKKTAKESAQPFVVQ
ncbi:hypothetical protein HDF18_11815 [Mucilaginibacter sp. X5P1]|uniref:hypothetical protein n=1 Tax=Mucilaginibacter sp. X5P1 TaxID=2723088 RepID=UPI0016106121|nr:hypothetical protein [Mucilaginibacter sp. X5P1]MBB6140497.1 hypothetical protein [Mucilaginibacter sp. X5P1]